MFRSIALLAVCLVLGCSRERLVTGIYTCSQWHTQVDSGSWNDLEIGSARRTALRRLRELGFGEVHSLSDRSRGERVARGTYRASATEREDSALAGLAPHAEWEAGRDQWWGHQAVTLTFDGDRLTRIAIARVLFLH